MIGSCNSSRRTSLRRAALAQLALAGMVPAVAAAPLTLQVEVSDTLPGFHIGAFPGYPALHMTEARLPDSRLEPAADKRPALDTVESTCNINPSARGEGHHFI